MKQEPRYGYYPWWPEDGNDWVHPEDVELARRLIPSTRVFRREGERGEYVVLHYGEHRLRVKRTLWKEVQSEGFEIGDWVEVLSRGYANTPRTAMVQQIHWEKRRRRLEYEVVESDGPIDRRYTAEDLRHVEPTDSLSLREPNRREGDQGDVGDGGRRKGRDDCGRPL